MNNVPRVKLSALANRFKDKIDLFICSASFEGRSVSVATSLAPEQVDATLVCCNKEVRSQAEPYLNFLLERFPSAIEVATELNDPLVTADNILRTIENTVGSRKIKSCLIDITTFTHEALLILLRVISIKFGGTRCTVKFVYTAASAYSINEPDIEKKWLARGVGTIRSVLGYSGLSDPAKKTHLVILTGFETERSMKLIDVFEPTKVSLGVVREHTAVSAEHFKINELNFNQLPIIKNQVDFFDFSCTNPTQAKIDLQHQIDYKSPDYNIVIAALNTKLSTIGVGLFAMEHPEVQLCYATANAYNAKYYSSPADFCYVFTKRFERENRVK